MKQPDSEKRKSFKISEWAKVTKEDYADFLLISSQYSLAMSVGVWLTLFQDKPKFSFSGIFTYALISFIFGLGFRWFSNIIRRSK